MATPMIHPTPSLGDAVKSTDILSEPDRQRLLELEEENQSLRAKLTEMEKENLQLKDQLKAAQESKQKNRWTRALWGSSKAKRQTQTQTQTQASKPALRTATSSLTNSSTPNGNNRSNSKARTSASPMRTKPKAHPKAPPMIGGGGANPYLNFSFIDDALMQQAIQQAQKQKKHKKELKKLKKNRQQRPQRRRDATNSPHSSTNSNITPRSLARSIANSDISSSTEDNGGDAMKTLMHRLELEIQVRTNQLKVANQNLEQANKRILEQSKTQLEQFACMSHELRTPLNCILGMSSLLLEDLANKSKPLDLAACQESLQMIVSSGELLAAIVNDVLDYFRLDNRTVEMDIRPAAPLQLTLQTVLDGIQTTAQERDIKVISSYGFATKEPQQQLFLQTDSRRLQQILYNLLGNAVKFSHQGGTIEFGVSLHQERLRFSIKDYGNGIASDKLTQIFEPFQQESASTQRLHGGTGLGLAITHRLVTALGGMISVQSELGKWSEFVVEFPQHVHMKWHWETQAQQPKVAPEAPANKETPPMPNSAPIGDAASVSSCSSNENNNPPPTPYPSPPTPSPTSSPTVSASSLDHDHDQDRSKNNNPPSIDISKIRVLVAEDNLVNQKILHKMLLRLGLKEIDIVDNGQKAVDLCTGVLGPPQHYDLIWMDMQMPIMDGLEATRLIRASSLPTTQPRIVFLTAHAFDQFQEAAFTAGADDFVSKPFNLQKITGLLKSLTFPRLQEELKIATKTLG